MRIKTALLFFIAITACKAGHSQTFGDAGNSFSNERILTSDDSKINSAEKITARFNFTGLVDPYDENASLGAEYKFDPQWSAGSDLAYIFSSEYLSDSKRTTGFIVRPFVRFYPNNERRWFLELQLHYKYASYQLKDWLGKDIVDGNPSYEELTNFHFIKKAMGLHFNFGTSANLSRDKKLWAEFYVGLGIRHKKQYADEGTYIRQKGWLVDLYQPDYATIVMPMGVRLVYDLKSLSHIAE